MTFKPKPKPKAWQRRASAVKRAAVSQPEAVSEPADVAEVTPGDGRGPLDGDLVQYWHETLMEDEERVRWWTDERGVSVEVLRERKIGIQWANRSDFPDGWRYTLPIWDAAGALVDAKRYLPGATNGKNKHSKGWGSPTRLSGVDWLVEADPSTDVAWIFGGEPDQLVGMTHGLLSLTGTGGEAAVPRQEDVEHLRGFRVNLCLDQDDAGRQAVPRWVAKLVPVVAELRVIEWEREKYGKDITELVVRGSKRNLFGMSWVQMIANETPPLAATQRDSQELLAKAITDARSGEGLRNVTGFDLACQLRDERYTPLAADRVMEQYAAAFADDPEPYPVDEALASRRSAYEGEYRAASGLGRPWVTVRSQRSAGDGGGADGEKPKTVAEKLLQIAADRYRFGRAVDGRLIAVPTGDGDPNLARFIGKGNAALGDELAALYSTRYTGKVPGAAPLADVMSVLRGIANNAEPEQMWMRVGEDGPGRLVIDLGDETGRAVVVSASGWEVVERSPVLFARTNLTGPLPAPVAGGSIDRLRDFLNTDPDTFDLIVALLVSYLFPTIAHGVLLFDGEYGTAKTWASRFTRMMFDPSPVLTQRRPTKEDDWDTSISAQWSVCLENVSTIPEWLSDAICRASTGDGRIKRKHYSDNDAFAEAVRRVVILNGISPLGIRDDLNDRLVVAELAVIAPADRKEETVLSAAWAEAWPALFGALLEVTVGVLRVRAEGRDDLAELPRLADAARVFRAVDIVRGTDALATFIEKNNTAASELAEDHPVSVAVAEHLFRLEGRSFTGTASDLMRNLMPPTPKPDGWPGNPRALSSQLTRLAPGLRKLGWSVAQRKSNGVKLWDVALPSAEAEEA